MKHLIPLLLLPLTAAANPQDVTGDGIVNHVDTIMVRMYDRGIRSPGLCRNVARRYVKVSCSQVQRNIEALKSGATRPGPRPRPQPDSSPATKCPVGTLKAIKMDARGRITIELK